MITSALKLEKNDGGGGWREGQSVAFLKYHVHFSLIACACQLLLINHSSGKVEESHIFLQCLFEPRVVYFSFHVLNSARRRHFFMARLYVTLWRDGNTLGVEYKAMPINREKKMLVWNHGDIGLN